MEERMNLRSLFANTDHVQVFQTGSTICAEGTPGKVMYVVLVGEMALIDAQARSATIVAKSDCRLALVDEQRFLFMVQETPFFALHVMRVLAERLRRWKPSGSLTVA